MDEAKANVNVNDEEDKKEENNGDPNNRDSDISGPQHFLLPSPFTRAQKQTQDYVHRPGISKYDVALKHLIPIRPKKSDSDKFMPADSAGLFSHIYVQWMTPYLWKAYKSGITIADLPPISPYDSANYNAQRLEALWQEELSRHGPTSASFKKIAWKFVRTRIFVSCFVLACSIILGFLSPAILMKKILEHVQSTEGTIWDGLKWVALLTLTDFFRTTFFAWTWVTNYRTAIRLKSACTAMLYRKIIRLNSLDNKSLGELINLFSNDSQRLFDVIIYGPMIISGPIATTCGILYILWIFNPIALLGIIVFLLFYPCQYMISRITGYFRARTVTVTDARVRLINEILECIKLIKMYSWESHFSKRLLGIREKEQSLLRRTAYFQSLSISLTPAVPIISAIVTFLAQVSSGHNLKASEVFPLVSLLNTQIRSFFMFIQVALVNIAESKIALNRLKSVILLEENSCRISKPIVRSQALSIFNGTFLCDGSITLEDSSKAPHNRGKESAELEKLNCSSEGAKYVKVLTDINFDVAQGALIGICGPVGSGKSSLLLAALGQLRMAKGHITREGSCAYVSQQAWIVNATLRQNVLFGEQFNAKRYYQALTVCNLKEDLNMLPGGDETEIGERGINLSGGQKQRIALARALYANRNIYFLDDPLSAVDAQVGSYIFENLILRALQGKTVLFVTHQVQFLKHCEQVYVMNGGKIIQYGTHVQLMQTSADYASMVNSTIIETDNNASTSKKNITKNVGTRSVAVQNGGDVERVRGGGTHTLTVEEKSEVGQVKGHTYNAYIKAAGGYFVAAVVILIFLLNVGSSAFSSWWLAIWIQAGGGNVTNPVTNETVYSENLNDNPDFEYYQTVYAACIGAILTMSLIRGFAITLTTINASTNLHNKTFKKMLSTSVKFFETTPSGRIQNIFSRDMDEVDNYLPISIENMIQNIFTCSFAIIFVCAVLPWYSIPLIFLGATFFLVSKLFRIAMRDFKRLENVSRAPVLSFITTTIQGLSTIHAFKKEKEFLDKFEELFDLNNLCLYLCQSGMRWSAVRLDSLAIASTCITAFLVIFLRGQISPALAGLAMAYCSQMSGVFQYTVRLMAETEVRFISVERINYYLRVLEQEGNNEKPSINPHADWPAAGKIEFQKVQMKYRKDLPVVLIDVTFVVQPGEKIGIVGRTGSGKSSLITALFRLVEICSGKIKIDNIDTSKIQLDLLRSKLSIIPQDPALFSGSIRSNLDPFNEHSDADIWEALEKTQLKGRVQKLEESVGFGGNKLSVGEKQLLCLARALLRNSKILVLDEATASVDPETEAVVNNTIQNEFAHCTILTIAHRLSSVVTCDRILVMSNGRIVESGPPDALRNNPTTEFSKMMAAAEDHINGVTS